MNIVKHDRTRCRHCNRPVDEFDFDAGGPDTRRFGGVSTYGNGKRQQITVFRLCDTCADVDLACAEADDEKRRYTQIGVGTGEFHSYNGDRCLCGAAVHATLSRCIRCSITHRMLNKADAENRTIAKILRELRSEIRSMKKQATELKEIASTQTNWLLLATNAA